MTRIPVYIPGPDRLAVALARLFDAPLIWQERLRERRHLSSLDDHMLRDIGLSRADLEHESAKPFWRP